MKRELQRGSRKTQYIQMDGWMQVCAFEFFVRYIYTGKLDASANDPQWAKAMRGGRLTIAEFSISELLNLFRIGRYFRVDDLTLHLLITILIPKMLMSSEVAVKALLQCE